jgi:hypothetical protein
MSFRCFLQEKIPRLFKHLIGPIIFGIRVKEKVTMSCNKEEKKINAKKVLEIIFSKMYLQSSQEERNNLQEK